MTTITICLVITILLLLMLAYRRSEGFASKREKAEVIHDWFSKNNSPTYSAYKSQVAGSDVYEYAQIRKSGAKDVGTIERVIS